MLASHGQPPIGVFAYVVSGSFVSALFEKRVHPPHTFHRYDKKMDRWERPGTRGVALNRRGPPE